MSVATTAGAITLTAGGSSGSLGLTGTTGVTVTASANNVALTAAVKIHLLSACVCAL